MVSKVSYIPFTFHLISAKHVEARAMNEIPDCEAGKLSFQYKMRLLIPGSGQNFTMVVTLIEVQTYRALLLLLCQTN